jgi:hypothetical protein
VGFVLRQDSVFVFTKRDLIGFENGAGLFDPRLGLRVADLLQQERVAED